MVHCGFHYCEFESTDNGPPMINEYNSIFTSMNDVSCIFISFYYRVLGRLQYSSICIHIPYLFRLVWADTNSQYSIV